jgi:hypothetical protein
MNLVRHVVFRAIQSDQHMSAKLAKVLQSVRTLQFGRYLGENRMKVVGTDRSARTWLSPGILSRPNTSGSSIVPVPPPGEAGAPGTTGFA